MTTHTSSQLTLSPRRSRNSFWNEEVKQCGHLRSTRGEEMRLIFPLDPFSLFRFLFLSPPILSRISFPFPLSLPFFFILAPLAPLKDTKSKINTRVEHSFVS